MAPRYPDFSDVKGQHHTKRALEIAAAGSHSILLVGPPGAGKSMLASRFPGLLPPMSDEEALEAAAVQSLTGTFMSTIELRPGAQLRLGGLLARNVFLYVVRGSLTVGPDAATAFHLAELTEQGDEVALASEHGALLLFGHADPIGEPVFSHGPFVMNTREEIVVAINDFQAGRCGPAL